MLFLIRLALPRRKIFVVLMDSRYFGHQCLEPEVFLNDMFTSAERGSRDIWLCCIGPESLANNKFMWRLMRDSLPVVPSWLATDVAFWQKRIRIQTIHFLPASIHRLNFLTSRATNLPVGDEIDVRRAEILGRFAKPHLPFVVFTVREWIPGSTNDLRNREIAAFEPAMVALAQRGWNVVRLTSRTSDLLATDGRQILDWQVLIDGEPGDELAILSGASFVVSTTTGGDCLALAYRRPVLYIDTARLDFAFLGTELATIHMPHFSDMTSLQRLTLEDILKRNLGSVGEQRLFEAAGVRVTNSSPDEIKGVVLEYLRDIEDESFARGQLDHEWRSLVQNFHGEELLARYGEIRAKMHPASLRAVTSPKR